MPKATKNRANEQNIIRPSKVATPTRTVMMPAEPPSVAGAAGGGPNGGNGGIT